MKIPREEVLKLAHLSMITFSEDELVKITNDLEALVAYTHEIMDADIIPTLDTYQNINVFRDDKVVVKNNLDILEQAPVRNDSYFVVPQILEAE